MIFILGANGYLGSNLLQMILKLKFSHLILVDSSYRETQQSERIDKTFIQYFRSIKELESDFFHNPEILANLNRIENITVINFAGYSRRKQFDGDLHNLSNKFSANILIVLDMVSLFGLLSERASKISLKLIHVSTAGMQFDASPTLYEFSKFGQEQLLTSWWEGTNASRINLVFIKLNDVFGGVNDFHDKVINRLRAKRQIGKSLPYIDKKAILRPISVEFVCNTILKLIDAPYRDKSSVRHYLLRPRSYFKIKELDHYLNLQSPTKFHTQILNFKSRFRAYFYHLIKERFNHRSVYNKLNLKRTQRDKELFENFDFLNFYYQSISKRDNRDEVICGH